MLKQTNTSFFSALIQLMAAAEAGRDVAYFTFGDAQLMRDVHAVHSFLTDRQVTIGETHKAYTVLYTVFCFQTLDIWPKFNAVC